MRDLHRQRRPQTRVVSANNAAVDMINNGMFDLKALDMTPHVHSHSP